MPGFLVSQPLTIQIDDVVAEEAGRIVASLAAGMQASVKPRDGRSFDVTVEFGGMDGDGLVRAVKFLADNLDASLTGKVLDAFGVSHVPEGASRDV